MKGCCPKVIFSALPIEGRKTLEEVDARNIILRALREGLKGPNRDCRYYPCHFDGQDCTWCYCPFYPCMDKRMGGFMTVSEVMGETVWSCMHCTWIHKPKAAQLILDELKRVSSEITRNGLQILRFNVWMKIASCINDLMN